MNKVSIYVCSGTKVRVRCTMVRVRGLEPESVGAVGAKGWWGSETSVGAEEHGA